MCVCVRTCSGVPPVAFERCLSFFPSLCSVAQLCLTLFNPRDCSTPGLPVHHQLLELVQTHVHRVGDAIQPSHPLSPPSPPAFSLSQHQGLFKRVGSSHQVAKMLELQHQHQSFQWIFRAYFFVAQLCPTLCEPTDCSPPGSSVRGIFQVRALEWAAISYTILSLSCLTFFFFKSFSLKKTQTSKLYHFTVQGIKYFPYRLFPLFIAQQALLRGREGEPLEECECRSWKSGNP